MSLSQGAHRPTKVVAMKKLPLEGSSGIISSLDVG